MKWWIIMAILFLLAIASLLIGILAGGLQVMSAEGGLATSSAGDIPGATVQEFEPHTNVALFSAVPKGETPPQEVEVRVTGPDGASLMVIPQNVAPHDEGELTLAPLGEFITNFEQGGRYTITTKSEQTAKLRIGVIPAAVGIPVLIGGGLCVAFGLAGLIALIVAIRHRRVAAG